MQLLDPVWRDRVRAALSYSPPDAPPRYILDAVKSSLPPCRVGIKDEFLLRIIDDVRAKDPQNSMLKRSKMSSPPQEPTWYDTKFPYESFDDIPGLRAIKDAVMPFIHYLCLGDTAAQAFLSRPPINRLQSLLLIGPRGCGKSTIARAIGAELPRNLNFAYLHFHGWQIQHAQKMKDVLVEMVTLINNAAPCVAVIDDIDLFLPSSSSDSKSDSENKRGLHFKNKLSALVHSNVLLVATAESMDKIDTNLFSPTTFSKFKPILIPPPDFQARMEILDRLLSPYNIQNHQQPLLPMLVDRTAGWTPQELVHLLQETINAAKIRNADLLEQHFQKLKIQTDAFKRIKPRITKIEPTMIMPRSKPTDELVNLTDNASDTVLCEKTESCMAESSNLESPSTAAELSDHKIVSPVMEEEFKVWIIREDFDRGIREIEPKVLKEGFTKIPDTNLAEVGGLETQRAVLEKTIIARIRDSEALSRVGLGDPSGVLLWGPPGCGKTLIAKAIAHECGAKFIYLRGAEFLNKYVGESELQVRKTFERARANAPCLIFFDEFDAICPNRENDGKYQVSSDLFSAASHEVSKRVVNALLLEMDGVVGRKGVFVVAATNRPNLLDPAMLRSGRLEHLVYVPPPDEESRYQVLKAISGGKDCFAVEDEDFREIARRSFGFSGADLNKLFKESAEIAFRRARSAESKDFPIKIPREILDGVVANMPPTLTAEQIRTFEEVRREIPLRNNYFRSE